LPPSYAFYNKEDALQWVKETEFPKVFKLRGGAGSFNVKLVRTRKAARKLIRRAFGQGFALSDKYSDLKQRFWELRRDKNLKAIIKVLKGFVRLVWRRPGVKLLPKQKGYVYFQDFLPNNKYDDRVVVIGDRVICYKKV